jgi:hypothetical protein
MSQQTETRPPIGRPHPLTFGQWLKNTSRKEYPSDDIVLECELDFYIRGFLTYLRDDFSAGFSMPYHLAFSSLLKQIQAAEIAEFDFQVEDPSLRLNQLPFKKWAEEHRPWYMTYNQPALNEYQIHRKLVEKYAEELVGASLAEYEDFMGLRQARARTKGYKLENMTWASLGVSEE